MTQSKQLAGAETFRETQVLPKRMECRDKSDYTQRKPQWKTWTWSSCHQLLNNSLSFIQTEKCGPFNDFWNRIKKVLRLFILLTWEPDFCIQSDCDIHEILVLLHSFVDADRITEVKKWLSWKVTRFELHQANNALHLSWIMPGGRFICYYS
jgi:hypothetical protein